MKKAAISFGIAGIAAAGALPPATNGPSAPAAAVASVAKVSCSPEGRDGRALKTSDHLRVNGARTAGKDLNRGDWILTERAGTAEVCLRLGGTVCDLDATTKIRVFPPNYRSALVWLARGGLTCKLASRAAPRNFETSGQLIRVGSFGRGGAVPGARAVARARAAAGPNEGHVFRITVRAGRTVVKVRRGATLVSRRGRPRRGVVAGRGKQVVIVRRRDPLQPTAIRLTSREDRKLDTLERQLPKLADRKPPATEITGPPDLSANTTANFALAAPEAAVFSCALDDLDFRVCSRFTRFADLQPGRHTLRARATDSAGNTGPVARYSWTVIRDHAAIAFESNRDGNWEIYVVNGDGSGETRLTNHPGQDVDAAWSPDGRRIAFESDRQSGQTADIYVMDADGGQQRPLTTDPANDRNPKWSPDGKRIAYESNRAGNYEIYVMNRDGTGETRLTFGAARDSDASWSPDGGMIVFESDRDGNAEIYVMQADGTQQTRLTTNAAEDSNPAWSPDGTMLAFESDRDGDHEIYVMGTGGGGETRLTFHPARDSDPAWSPDGTRIAFASDRFGNLDIHIMNRDGTNPTRVTTSQGDDLVPHW